MGVGVCVGRVLSVSLETRRKNTAVPHRVCRAKLKDLMIKDARRIGSCFLV